jgi:hypothetical protein
VSKIYASGRIIHSSLGVLLATRRRCAGMKVAALHRFAFGQRLCNGKLAGHLERSTGYPPPGMRSGVRSASLPADLISE